MRFLHTSDWHLGKVLKGVPRIDEQRRVLAEIRDVARSEDVDVVLVAGDVFESAVPTPEAQALAYETLLDLRTGGAEVVVISGNHDNALAFDAIRPLAGAAGLHVIGQLRRPDEGGVLRLTGSAGETAQIVVLPFMSQRRMVRAPELMNQNAAANAGTYAERCRTLLGALCGSFSVDTVNVVLAHAMVRGGTLGGGERDAQTIEDYWIDPTAFPATAQFVALGHLHRTQQLAGAAPVWYSGSPIQVDFGEGGDAKHVLLVDVEPGRPAVVQQIPLRGVRRLSTVEGSIAELQALAQDVGDDLLRVLVNEPARAGLADEVRAILPNAIDIKLSAAAAEQAAVSTRQGKSPHELLHQYMQERGIDDDRVERLFAQLADEMAEADA